MNLFRKSLLIIIVLTVTAVISGVLITKASDTVYPDLTEDSVYYPHIKRLSEEFFVSEFGNTGNYLPDGTVTRADIAKMVAYTRLAEKYGITDRWSEMNKLGMALEIFSLLKPYFGCQQDACVNIGGMPFTDVPESDPECMEDLNNMDKCKPWFSRFVYYIVSKGLTGWQVNADGTKSFMPMENISRLHAIKMIIADKDNIPPEDDLRYKRLLSQAVRLNSYLPKCLIGAENYIKDLNGGNTENSKKLLAYALLADRLDMFGNKCQVFGSAVTPEQRARFLQEPLTRGEMPRYFAITTAYQPIRPPSDDTTINTVVQNKNSDAGSPSYSIPPYSQTPIYDPSGGDESVWGGDTGTAPVKKSVVPVALKRPIYDKNTPYPTNKTIAPSAGVSGTGTSGNTTSHNQNLHLTDQFGEDCGIIPASAKFNLLIVLKGKDGEFYQYTDYDRYRLCRFPCSAFPTQKCKAESEGITAPKLSVPPVTGYTTTKTTTPYSGVVKTQLVASGVGDKPWYSVAWDAVGNAKDATVNWITDSKRGEGYKQLGWGTLETLGGIGSGAVGLSALGIGGFGTAASGGTASPVTIPMAIGGATALSYAANSLTGGLTNMWSGAKNIVFGGSGEIYDERFSPMESAIKATTEEGSWERTTANVVYYGGDIITGSAGWIKITKDVGYIKKVPKEIYESVVTKLDNVSTFAKNVYKSGANKLDNFVTEIKFIAGNNDAYEAIVRKKAVEKGLDFDKIHTEATLMQKKAYESVENFHNTNSDIGKELGYEYKGPDPKGTLRSTEKAIVDYDGDVNRLKDLNRGQYTVNNYDEAEKLKEKLAKEYNVDKKNIKDTLNDEKNKNSWKDIKITTNVNGIKNEIQIVPRELDKANELTHSLYSIERTMPNTIIGKGAATIRNTVNTVAMKTFEFRVNTYEPMAKGVTNTVKNVYSGTKNLLNKFNPFK